MSNFIVSARKYRPATFESVVGQSHITETLRNAISRSQLAHAYLFCGPRGVGKTTCARIFAKAINCLSPTDNQVCGVCESCRSFNEGRSFNIHELDAASNNSVDDIRSLTEQVRIPPQIGRYSVYIIDEVHMLSASAFNAFLKTLEEPPPHAIFILATTEKHKIIPTILSRCQIYDFNRIRVEDGVGYLKYIAQQESVSYDDESLHLIAQKADGGMRDALSMFDKAVSFCGSDLCFKEVAMTLNILDYDTYFNVTSFILAGDYPAALTLFDEVLRNGFSGQVFIAGLNTHFRDMLMCKNSQTAGLLEVTGTLLDRYTKQGAECDVGFLFEAIALLTTLDGTLRTATNQRLNVELGLMKLCGLGQKKNKRTVNKEDEVNLSWELATHTDTVGKTKLPPLRKEVQQKSAAGAPMPIPVPVPQSQAGEQTQRPVPQQTSTEQKTAQQTSPVPAKPAVPATTALPKLTNGNGSPTISGTSITSLLNTPMSHYDVGGTGGGGGEQKALETPVDPECEQKIAAVKERFIRNLKSDRPRIAMAFEQMKVSGHRISFSVPSETLFEEIMRNRIELLTLLSEIADITGILELDVTVKEDTGVKKPIKVEDKLRFLTEQNPALTILRQKLDMDIE